MDRHLLRRRPAAPAAAGSAGPPRPAGAPPAAPAPWGDLEAALGGRLGVTVLDTATGRHLARRGGERFPMCSTFKWLGAARALQLVDAGRDSLERRIPVRPDDLLEHAPAARQRVGASMTIAELCAASVALSDNTAANLLLAAHGGPAGVTAAARALGDRITRLDRNEPGLNEARPGDPRDTTTPDAMAGLLQRALVGQGLSPASRVQLDDWMRGTRTSDARLRKHLPDGWALADKTGTGARGTSNDVGVYHPPAGRAPIVVAVYITGSTADAATRDAAIARIGAEVIAAA